MDGRYQARYLPYWGGDFEAPYLATNDLNLAFGQALGAAACNDGVAWEVYDWLSYTAYDVTPRGWRFGKPNENER